MPLKNKMFYIFDGLVDNICHKIYVLYLFERISVCLLKNKAMLK